MIGCLLSPIHRAQPSAAVHDLDERTTVQVAARHTDWFRAKLGEPFSISMRKIRIAKQLLQPRFGPPQV